MARRLLLYLEISVDPVHHDSLISFLRAARAHYESLPGVSVRLLRSTEETSRYLEVIEYPDQTTFDRDHARLESDELMRGYLQQWRSLLAGPARTSVYEDLTPLLAGATAS